MGTKRSTAVKDDTPAQAAAGVDRAMHEYRLALLRGAAEALSNVVRGDTEIVVHDFRTPDRSIVKIVNGHISGRREGQPIIAGLFGDQAFDVAVEQIHSGEPNGTRVVGSYKSRTHDGKVLESSSMLLFDDQANPAAAFCINVDPTALDQMRKALKSLDACDIAPTPALQVREPTVEELVEDIIDTALAAFDAPALRLSKQERVAAVATMHERGLFMLKGSAELVAKRLGATKFTIYNYLEEIGKGREAANAAVPTSD